MKEAPLNLSMKPTMNFARLRRATLVACAALVFAAAAPAQDSDDDGALPHHQGPSASEPGTVGVSSASPGIDQLVGPSARLSITAMQGQTTLDTSALPADAMFVALGPYRYEYGDEVSLQGHGQLMMPEGYDITLLAAPQSIARTTLLVVHQEAVSLAALLTGTAAPLYVLKVGDLAAADLSLLQGLTVQHASSLPGLAVSVVDVSVDTKGLVHVAGARFTTESGPVEIVID
jgi:hypothetical protein